MPSEDNLATLIRCHSPRPQAVRGHRQNARRWLPQPLSWAWRGAGVDIDCC